MYRPGKLMAFDVMFLPCFTQLPGHEQTLIINAYYARDARDICWLVNHIPMKGLTSQSTIRQLIQQTEAY